MFFFCFVLLSGRTEWNSVCLSCLSFLDFINIHRGETFTFLFLSLSFSVEVERVDFFTPIREIISRPYSLPSRSIKRITRVRDISRNGIKRRRADLTMRAAVPMINDNSCFYERWKREHARARGV